MLCTNLDVWPRDWNCLADSDSSLNLVSNAGGIPARVFRFRLRQAIRRHLLVCSPVAYEWIRSTPWQLRQPGHCAETAGLLSFGGPAIATNIYRYQGDQGLSFPGFFLHSPLSFKGDHVKIGIWLLPEEDVQRNMILSKAVRTLLPAIPALPARDVATGFYLWLLSLLHLPNRNVNEIFRSAGRSFFLLWLNGNFAIQFGKGDPSVRWPKRSGLLRAMFEKSCFLQDSQRPAYGVN